MSLSSFCVVSNALRLNLFKMQKKMPNQFQHDINKQEIKMEKKISINGMMCEHCEMHVKKALEALDFVEIVK